MPLLSRASLMLEAYVEGHRGALSDPQYFLRCIAVCSDMFSVAHTLGKDDTAAHQFLKAICGVASNKPSWAIGASTPIALLCLQADKPGLAVRILERASAEIGEMEDAAPALVVLAMVKREIGDDQSAENLLKKALESEEHALGKEHSNCAAILEDLAITSTNRGNHRNAQWLLTRALKIKEKIFGKQHAACAQTHELLALAYGNCRDYEAAVLSAKEAVRINRERFGNQSQRVSASLVFLAHSYLRQGAWAEAESCLEEEVAITRSSGRSAVMMSASITSLAVVFWIQNKIGAAIDLLREYLGLLRQEAGESDVAATMLSKAIAECEGFPRSTYGRILSCFRLSRKRALLVYILTGQCSRLGKILARLKLWNLRVMPKCVFEWARGTLNPTFILQPVCSLPYPCGESYRLAPQASSVTADLLIASDFSSRQLDVPETNTRRPAMKARTRTGRNAPCPCGSGEKFKNCCLQKANRDDRRLGP
jgi:tetratricopeptide (TPR) repeat protein